MRHLKDYGYITAWEAIMEYGCTRLSHYIYLARRNGHSIYNERIRGKNRYGEPTHYVKYILKGDEDDGRKKNVYAKDN